VEFFSSKTNFPFMATRKVWYSLSIVLMLVSFGSFFVKGLNFAIEFTGGVNVEANFSSTADVERVRKAVEAAGFHEPQVQNFGSSRDVAIRLADTGEKTEVLRPKLSRASKWSARRWEKSFAMRPFSRSRSRCC
jgi:preprotein translocase subunit SecF